MMAATALGLPSAYWLGHALIFNTQPALYLHDSWYAQLPQGAMLASLSRAPRARPWVSRHLLEVLGLEGRYVEDFAHPWARLALIDGPWLERLMRRLGLALRAPSLRHELSGERLRQIKASLSAEDWQFLTRETLLLGPIPEFRSAPQQATDPLDQFALLGLRFCVLHGLGALDGALIRRLALKLPAAWSPTFKVSRAPRSASLPPLLRKLLRELPPAWTPLFA